jgi:hypothetical protein
MNITTLGQGAKVLQLILQKETTSEQMQDLLESGLLADILDANVGSVNREDFRELLGLGKTPDIMELTGVVLPELSVTYGDRINAGGYDLKDKAIKQKRFPLTLPAGLRNLVLVHFNKVMTNQEVAVWAKENGYEFALFDDLLAVGSHPEYKDLQRQFPIIQLGSSARVYGSQCMPCLWCRHGTKRDLYLSWFLGSLGWAVRCRFLLVRKP